MPLIAAKWKNKAMEAPVFDMGAFSEEKKPKSKKLEGQPSKNLMAERRRRILEDDLLDDVNGGVAVNQATDALRRKTNVEAQLENMVANKSNFINDQLNDQLNDALTNQVTDRLTQQTRIVQNKLDVLSEKENIISRKVNLKNK